ncbi:alanine--tRNA ligase, partial [SAR202 cluster bacterium AD-804-J14_MRT_500m]|nr:alanine--tRNA ligase [SAR202 cluster bacterium AD-804-J14_MRT_500m]
VVLRQTPFYPEGGGQVGDRGQIITPNAKIEITDTQSPTAGLIIHYGTITNGDVSLGDAVWAQVDVQNRIKTMRNHSGTHILHASLRSVLGTHVRQAGSLNNPDHLRFDYTHVGPLSRTELRQIQSLSNQKIRENLHVNTVETTYANAISQGALAFFGDKYGDIVRVVEMRSVGTETPFSLEACGGTHIAHTGEIGPLLILGDSGIGGGMRRIEAITGDVADSSFMDNRELLHSISRKLETSVDGLEIRLEGFLAELDTLRKCLQKLERDNLRLESKEILTQVQQINGVNVIASRTTASNIEAMREMGDWIKRELSSVILVLALNNQGNPMLISMVTSDLVGKGFHAGDIVRETAKILGGGGGGRAESAQAGGKHLDKLPKALKNVSEIVRRQAKP